MAAKQAIERFIEWDPTFASTRECILLQDLLAALDANDEDMFLDKLQEYDQMSKLDRWKTAVFLEVKKGIDAEPDLT